MRSYYLNLDTIIKISHQLKAQGRDVVFTHGCFDLMHAGHLHLLQSSKKMGDVLIVGVESDARIRKHKNPNGPVISENERLQLLTSTRAVDFAFLIKGNAPWADSYYIDLYRKINPKVVTYGDTFGYKKRLEARKGKLKGIKLVLIDELSIEMGSTSKIIRKIANLSSH